MAQKQFVSTAGALLTLLVAFFIFGRTANAHQFDGASNLVATPKAPQIYPPAEPPALDSPSAAAKGDTDPERLSLSVASPTDRSAQSPLLQAAPAYRVFMPMVAMPPSAQAAAPSKRGVGTPSPYQYCDDLVKLRTTWFFDWSAHPPSCNGVENVPMIWGRSLPSSAAGNSAWLMVWNEPNNPNQANLSPSEAASLFPTIEQRFSNKKLVVGNTYDGYGGLTPGIQWLTAFIDAYSKANGKPPRLDGIGMHCYQWTASECIQTTQPFVQLAGQVGAEVWVTEFAFYQGYNQRSAQQVEQEMQTYLGYLKSEPRVTRYAWFANRIYGTEPWANPPGWNSPLIDSRGVLTAYGTSYIQ